jgi:hypothetical protein
MYISNSQRPPVQGKEKKKRKEGETMKNSARERGAEFGRNNNTPVAISL